MINDTFVKYVLGGIVLGGIVAWAPAALIFYRARDEFQRTGDTKAR